MEYGGGIILHRDLYVELSIYECLKGVLKLFHKEMPGSQLWRRREKLVKKRKYSEHKDGMNILSDIVLLLII